MPIPRRIAEFNRSFTNRLTLRLAGRLPWFGIVNHVGRRSGRPYRTPVNIFPTGDEYIIALTYQGESDWVKNVLAAGSCDVETRGRCVHLVNPRIVTDRTNRWAPLLVRLALNTIRVTQAMHLSPTESKSDT